MSITLIKNIFSSSPEKEITVEAALEHIRKETGSCGLYYEITISRLTTSARYYLECLPESDKTSFQRRAEEYGIPFDDADYEAILRAEKECWQHIHKAQE
jgi:hypothetical protein